MAGFLRSLFGSKKSASKIKPRMQRHRLELLGLEERIVPNGQTPLIASFSNGTLLLANDNTSKTFTVTTDANGVLTVTGLSTSITSGGNVTIGGTSGANTVTVDSSAGGAAAVSLLSFTGGTSTEDITLTNINSTAFNTNFGLLVDTSSGTDTLAINGLVVLKGTGALTTAGIETLNIDAAGDIIADTGAVSIEATTINTAGDVTTTSGAIDYIGDVILSGAVAINSTSGNVAFSSTINGTYNLTINSGSGIVEVTGDIGNGTELSNLTINSTHTTPFAISLANVNASGTISLTGVGDVSVGDVISAASVNAKSTAGDVFFGYVTTTQVGGFTSETSDATKATKIEGTINVGAGANALITGNLVSNDSTNASITTIGAGNITITGNVDASASGNNLTLEAGSGVITISGNVGSGSIDFGDLIASGTGTFLASGTIKANKVDLNQTDNFATSITFAKAVTATSSSLGEGVYVSALGTAPITFLDTITTSGNPATSGAVIRLGTLDGAINVAGAITGLDFVEITTNTGAITLNGNVTTSGTNAGGSGGLINITSIRGNVLLSGNISTTGTGDIKMRTIVDGTLTINGNVSTAATTAGKGDIYIGAFNQTSAVSPSVTINGIVTTTGSTAGDIYIGINGGTATVNKAVTAGPTGDVVFITTLATDVIAIASGANITAGDGVADLGPGALNLGASITIGNGSIILDNVSISLTGAVSMKAAGGTTGAIILANVNGAQNLTLEATGAIILNNTGQTTALKTVTVTNSDGFATISTFNVANMVLTDSTNTIAFSGATVITSGLTTAAKAYSVSFAGTTVLSGAPVFLNTGGVSFGSSGNGNTTSLTNGATIIGNATSSTNLGGIIVSGGAFNIGTAGDTGIISIANGTQLILNSTSAGSTFANPVAVTAGSQTFNLLGVGSLTLSGDSSANTGDNFNVTNGTLNVTGKIASTVTLTNGTITGAGGTIGALNCTIGNVTPGGTLQTDNLDFGAATNFNIAVVSSTVANNLEVATSATLVSLGNAVLNLTSVATGLKAGNQLTIVNNISPLAITGTFAGLPEGSSVSAKDTSGNTVNFRISYMGADGSTGNDVVLTVESVIPSQPATPQPMVAGQPPLYKFTAFGADAGGGPLVTITFANGTYTSFFAYDPAFLGGVRVALGDVNADGTPEVITGAGAGGGPQVNVYSVNTLSGVVTLQNSFFAFNTSTFSGGVYVAAGDTNGDAFDDVIVGAGAGGGPRVQVYAGSVNGVVTTSTLNDFFAYAPAFSGGVVVAAGDRNADGDDEVVTAPASNGGWNIKSFDCKGTGNSPTLVDNFFAFNNNTAVGGLSLAVGFLNLSGIADLVVGTTSGAYGVILDSDTSGIIGVPFAGFAGTIRAGVAEDSTGEDYAVALAGPGGGPRVSVFSGRTSPAETDNLFVMNPAFTGGLFGTPTIPRTVV